MWKTLWDNDVRGRMHVSGESEERRALKIRKEKQGGEEKRR